MDKEILNDTKNENAGKEISQYSNPFPAYIPAGITWLTGLLFLQIIDHVFLWWTLICIWFPLYYTMKRRFPAAEKKWNIANGFAVAFLLVIPGLFCLLYIGMAPFL
ncbi:MAG: hypothetical protein IJW23_08880 [Lentisphaeria bacterium]|nr:hypothetical protein [Lentisphaeria bacterium]